MAAEVSRLRTAGPIRLMSGIEADIAVKSCSETEYAGYAPVEAEPCFLVVRLHNASGAQLQLDMDALAFVGVDAQGWDVPLRVRRTMQTIPPSAAATELPERLQIGPGESVGLMLVSTLNPSSDTLRLSGEAAVGLVRVLGDSPALLVVP